MSQRKSHTLIIDIYIGKCFTLMNYGIHLIHEYVCVTAIETSKPSWREIIFFFKNIKAVKLLNWKGIASMLHPWYSHIGLSVFIGLSVYNNFSSRTVIHYNVLI